MHTDAKVSPRGLRAMLVAEKARAISATPSTGVPQGCAIGIDGHGGRSLLKPKTL
jgi:hypothetical protein